MEKPAIPYNFWITNISKSDVCLGDLNVTVKAMSSINLLDKKHYPHLTLNMVEKSEKSGSLFKRSNKIFHRKIPPIQDSSPHIQVDTVSSIPTRQHSIIEIKEEKYDELNIINEDDIILNINMKDPNDKE